MGHGQSVWYKDDIAQIGATLVAVAPSWDFAAGVAALCNAIGAPVKLPERGDLKATRVIDVTGKEALP